MTGGLALTQAEMSRAVAAPAVTVGWYLRNLGRLLVILPIGFFIGAAMHPEYLPDDARRGVGALLGNAIGGGFLYGGMFMLPMAFVYLTALALIARRQRPQRIIAVALSPIVGALIWFTGVPLSLDLIWFAVGIPAMYGSIVALPSPRQHLPDDRPDSGKRSI